MKPIKLTMTAFGPFAGTEVIDFQQMDKEPVFLICGPTGAGKTMIFDAIAYALFGEASGQERKPEELRSDFAGDDVLTEVELIFAVRGQSYRIYRQPRQLRRKKSGEGVTEVAAKAELSYTDAGGAVWVFTRAAEINEKVREILGLGADQFKQIMMLPQGEFRKLLTADSKEREAILRDIFDAARYLQLQLALKQESDRLEKEIKEIRKLQQQWILQLQAAPEEAAGLAELLAKEEIDRPELFAAVRRQNESDIRQAEMKKEKAEQLAGQVQQKKETLFYRQQENEKLSELKRVQAYLLRLKARAEEIRQKEAEAEAIRRALVLKPYAEQCRDLARQAEQLAAEKVQRQAALQAAEAQKEKLAQSYQAFQSEEYKAALVAAGEELQTLGREIPLLRSLLDLRERYNRLKQENSVKEKEFQEFTGQKEKLQIRMKELRRTLEETESSEAAKTVLEQKLAQFLKWKELWQKEESCRRRQKENKAAEQELAERLDAAEKLYQSEQEKLRHNHVLALRQDLKDGDICPVCLGVYRTPAGDSGRAEAADLKRAEQAREEVRREQEALLKKQTELAAQSRLFTEQLIAESGRESLSEIRQYLSQKEAEQADMQKQAAEYARQIQLRRVAKKELEQAAAAEEELLRREKEITAEYRQKQAELNEAAGQGRALKESISAGYREKASLAAVKELERRRIKLETERAEAETKREQTEKDYRQSQVAYAQAQTSAEEAERHSRQRQEQWQKAKAEFQSRLTAQNFADETAWRQTADNEAAEDALRAEVKAYGEEWLRSTETEKRLRQEVTIETPHPLAQTEEEIRQLEADRAAAGERAILLRRRADENERVLKELIRMEQRRESEKKEYAGISALAKAANGENIKKLTFERYVLAVFLEDVLRMANYRLAKMTGRYTLKRKEEVTHRGRQSGLEIEVFDAFTGKTRNVNTLSGGEGFKAALAMALGLSEVISAYAGGIELDMLLIDEGFGTLDPESLDAAVDCILELQAGGKLIGIISHVAELKERIPAKLEVRQTPQGSYTKYRIGAADEA